MSQEQIDEVKRYMKIKDFYEILGVPKDAQEEQIKKAYKKLALKFHPDKNKAEGSKEVFKKIAQAYDCLVNAEKRAVYDRYGDEEPEQHYQHYRQQYHDDISPDNIFEMLFGKNNPMFQFQQEGIFRQGTGGTQVFYTSFGNGGGMHGGPQNLFDMFMGGNVGGRQTLFQRQQQGQRQQQQQQQQQHQQQRKTSKLMTIIQLLPFILILFSGYFTSLFKEGPLYSLEYSRSHDIKRESKLLHLNYYVASSFIDKNKLEPTIQKQVEHEIESVHVEKLRKECFQNQQLKRQIQVQLQAARTDSDKKYYNNKLISIKMTSCSQLDKYKEEFHVDVDAIFL